MGLYNHEGVANNVLCYISTARNSIARNKILLNCIAYYTSQEIKAAKEVIFNICGLAPINRKGNNKSSANVDDVLKLFDEKSNSDNVVIPKFFADGYTAFPPKDFDSIAPILAHMSDEISAVKIELNEVKEAKSRDMKALDDFGCVRQDVSDIKLMLLPKNTPPISSSFDTQTLQTPTVELNATNENTETSATSEPIDNVIPSASEIISNIEKLQQNKSFSSAARPPPDAETRSNTFFRRNNSAQSHKPGENLPMNKTNPENMKKLDQRRFKVVGVGKHKGRSLNPAKRKDLDIYVGGLDVETTSVDIETHCNENNIIFTKIEKLATKSQNHQPFKITVAAADREKYLIPEIWPEGVFVRKYFNPRSSKNN